MRVVQHEGERGDVPDMGPCGTGRGPCYAALIHFFRDIVWDGGAAYMGVLFGHFDIRVGDESCDSGEDRGGEVVGRWGSKMRDDRSGGDQWEEEGRAFRRRAHCTHCETVVSGKVGERFAQVGLGIAKVFGVDEDVGFGEFMRKLFNEVNDVHGVGWESRDMQVSGGQRG